eukprot:CAMPEP_0119330456 /NCGR_PEP_ID=MMETSP1333-20130426/78322_1 /TAXON_ID=418940 /ORGANISM="Scyphosphaera apsteinii, Strain RCC1455" /LENGTH=248 /DNA_ID=CAMNT_0007339849 /DNA_START=45 /DNA_END=792 /DNA_ORIENTATION=+
MALPDKNYVHEAEIWRQRLQNEEDAAHDWPQNWGFLIGKGEPPPRGFSTALAKYIKPVGGWTVKSIRVPDNSEEGIAAACSEQKARMLLTTVKANTRPSAPVKYCESPLETQKGMPLVHDDFTGVHSTWAALTMRAHVMQVLGDACRTEGLNPKTKYKAPILASMTWVGASPPELTRKGERILSFLELQIDQEETCAERSMTLWLESLHSSRTPVMLVADLGDQPYHRKQNVESTKAARTRTYSAPVQ